MQITDKDYNDMDMKLANRMKWRSCLRGTFGTKTEGGLEDLFNVSRNSSAGTLEHEFIGRKYGSHWVRISLFVYRR